MPGGGPRGRRGEGHAFEHYEQSGHTILSIDAKSNTTTTTFDARVVSQQTDRLSGRPPLFAYTATGQLASLTDAENPSHQLHLHTAGTKLTEIYPDQRGPAAQIASG